MQIKVHKKNVGRHIFINTRSICLQGDIGPLTPGLPVQVPLWMAVNLKQGQKCRIVPPEWMDIGQYYSVIGIVTNLGWGHIPSRERGTSTAHSLQ